MADSEEVMIRCRVLRPHEVELPEKTLRSGSVTPDLFEQSVALLSADSRNYKCGLWVCDEGEFHSSKVGVTEVSIILHGEGFLHDADGTTHPFSPGDLLFLPDGWYGIWRITASVRKWYISMSSSAT
jgi:uncharacterized cupin superfamily protein